MNAVLRTDSSQIQPRVLLVVEINCEGPTKRGVTEVDRDEKNTITKAIAAKAG